MNCYHTSQQTYSTKHNQESSEDFPKRILASVALGTKVYLTKNHKHRSGGLDFSQQQIG